MTDWLSSPKPTRIDRGHGGQAFGDIVDSFPISELGVDGMPYRGMSAMDEKREFVEFAMSEGVNVRELCRRFRISPTTGYKWLGGDGTRVRRG